MEQLKRDLVYLAGSLPHRGSNTETERAAAEYIRDRFRESVDDVEIDDFDSPETTHYLYAAYYAEFAVVALLAHWFPRVALCYGGFVFLAYLAESMGYNVLGRFMPQFATQNVVARFLGDAPEALFIVTAHYDTGKASFLSHPRVVPWLRRAHSLVLLCMLLVIVSCATEALGIFGGAAIPYDVIVRWVAVAYLVLAAGALAYAEWTGDYVQGAIGNAAGVAAILRLAERFEASPIDTADVWLVATGSGEGGMNGIRQLLKTHTFDPASTYFVNIDHVGAGRLRYVTGEGMVHVHRCSPELVRIAENEAAISGAQPLVFRGQSSETLVPLCRGYKAAAIMATGDNDVLAHRRWHTDALGQVEYGTVMKAAQFAENILRALGKQVRGRNAPE